LNTQRADVALVQLGLVHSRAAATEAIKSGRVNCNGKPITKPSHLVPPDAELTVSPLVPNPLSSPAPPLPSFCAEPPHSSFCAEHSAVAESHPKQTTPLVSRAGGKLEAALAELRGLGNELYIENKNCLDIGASTGGFTQVLLNHGAAQVIALDVGHGQLRPEVRQNPNVTVMERVNARYLAAADLQFRPEFITCDVSFISCTMLFEPIRAVAAPGAQVLLLIKPQFEVGKGKLGKGGIVRDQKLIAQTLQNVTEKAEKSGINVAKVIPSAVVGQGGNQEYFLFGKVR
jgi:23S rRNA (cytidine1920-2'-O)/16S rRNA (cytidine1409-2'-O)-methyltransferase